MKITEHLDKISWSVADKMLFIGYGIVTIVQFEAMSPEDTGLFGLLFGIFSWIFIVSDSFALQNIIQFGTKVENRGRVNLISFVLHISLTLGLSMILYWFRLPISEFFSEPRLVYVFSYLPLLSLMNVPRTYSLKVFYRDIRMAALFSSNAVYFGVMTIVTFYYIFAYNGIDFHGIVMIYLIGTMSSTIVSIFLIKKDLRFSLKGDFRIREMIIFTVPYTLSGSLHMLPRQIDIYIVQFFFQTQTAGLYFLAKNLFRVFEEIVNAANGLIYPAAVRQLSKNDFASLRDMMSKSISLILFFNLFCVVLLNLGATEFLVKLFLSEKYYASIPMFNILSIVSIGLPATIIGAILAAYGKPHINLYVISFILVFWLGSFWIIGKIGNQNLIAVPNIIYYFMLSIGLIYFAKKYFGYKVKDIFRVFGDVYYFAKKRFNK